jgi:hypothetical protein
MNSALRLVRSAFCAEVSFFLILVM